MAGRAAPAGIESARLAADRGKSDSSCIALSYRNLRRLQRCENIKQVEAIIGQGPVDVPNGFEPSGWKPIQPIEGTAA